ncbi:MAG: tRNA pseudouridine synthase A [Flavobacteriales bacterium]|jgi:tRNA pseudouridine38-40 synthase|nr:tRNA pseudouridine synthase A [Flavobacteriales bacterium]
MRYFIHLGFDGTSYSGWQRQKDTRNTVQEVVERTLSQLFKKKVSAYGCGRTDMGVHASQYVIQINLDEAPTFDLQFRLNKNLPDDMAVFEVIEVSQDQHCRYDAVARTYDYFIHWRKDPVLMRHSAFYDGANLDFGLMKEAVALIRETKDFRALCKQPELYTNTLCRISKCELFVNQEQGRMRFTITSDRFLRGMIRICIYFLLEVGSGRISLDEFAEILNQRKLSKEKFPSHPNGLFLTKVEYPYLELKESHQLIKMLRVGLE